MDTCNECGGPIILNGLNKLVCNNCGLVYSDEGFVKAHHSTSPMDRLGVEAVGSYVGYGHEMELKDFLGRPLDTKSSGLFKRLQRLHVLQPRLGKGEARFQGERVLVRVCHKLNLPQNVIKTAASLYRKAIVALSRQRYSRFSIIATCIVMAMRTWRNTPSIRIKNVISILNALGHRVSFNSLEKSFIAVKKALKVRVSPRRHVDYVPYIVEEAFSIGGGEKKLGNVITAGEYKMHIIEASQELLINLDEKLLRGKAPHVLAAAAIYTVARSYSKKLGVKNVFTQRILSKTVDVAEFSIRDHISKFFKNLSSGTEYEGYAKSAS